LNTFWLMKYHKFVFVKKKIIIVEKNKRERERENKFWEKEIN
jgi:hypothetical protein